MSRAAQIAALNDAYRRSLLGGCGVPGRTVMTRGVASLPSDVVAAVLRGVQTFDAFTPDNDPYGEHDFGSLDLPDGTRVFWKIDYLADAHMEFGAECPEDPAASYRVMTVMLAHEY